jgi:AbrB family looped-hinge helix DNA binding protein
MKEERIAQSKVTRRSQITIPKRVQDKLGKIKEGEYILFFEEDNRIWIKKGEIVEAPSKKQ